MSIFYEIEFAKYILPYLPLRLERSKRRAQGDGLCESDPLLLEEDAGSLVGLLESV